MKPDAGRGRGPRCTRSLDSGGGGTTPSTGGNGTPESGSYAPDSGRTGRGRARRVGAEDCFHIRVVPEASAALIVSRLTAPELPAYCRAFRRYHLDGERPLTSCLVDGESLEDVPVLLTGRRAVKRIAGSDPAGACSMRRFSWGLGAHPSDAWKTAAKRKVDVAAFWTRSARCPSGA